MMKYEIKKVLSRAGNKAAMLLLLAVLGVAVYSAVNVSYVDEAGTIMRGPSAASRLRADQKKWAGTLDETKIRQAIEKNAQVNASPEGQSDNETQSNIAFSRKQGFAEIRNLINRAYADEFRMYDYYKADSLTAADAADFYTNRLSLLKEWLNSEAKEQFSETEKNYLIQQYETLETPFYYDYTKGWIQCLEFTPMVIMITVLILGYLVAGIFSNEFQWKSDAIFFTTVYGRNRAVLAKIKAGFCIVTFVYWAMMFLYTGIVLLYLGADGAACLVQADESGWKCFYNLTIWQEYLLTIAGGYIGCLFMSFLTMLVSAKTRSAVLAVLIPFILIFLPSFVANMDMSFVHKVLGLLPDQLLQVNQVVKLFNLYQIGGKIYSAVPILLVMYSVLTILLLPIMYHEYKQKQIK